MIGSPAIETTWTAEPFVPASRSLRTLRLAVRGCQGCPLYANTTQAVFGEGDRSAPIVTYHPSAVLRAEDAAAEIREALVEDLRRAHRLAEADA